MSGTTKAANYQIGFPQGPMSVNGVMTSEWQRFFLWMFNRTGSSQGIDGAYVAGQSSQNASDIAALTLLAKEALQDAQLALADALAIRAEARKALETAEDLAIMRVTTCNARDGSFLNESMVLPTMI
ncbi:hypothetical protein [Gluconobacter albidus]|uniref:hypothetical protein n=1 Tax=Gluconobacter albidus TaxID=318683 RepID=UPI001B8C9064|nr:hypothetical protein [Gluconobacter albidus]MBS1028310.1 hypothetical protein [Gluconobacter albidus]